MRAKPRPASQRLSAMDHHCCTPEALQPFLRPASGHFGPSPISVLSFPVPSGSIFRRGHTYTTRMVPSGPGSRSVGRGFFLNLVPSACRKKVVVFLTGFAGLVPSRAEDRRTYPTHQKQLPLFSSTNALFFRRDIYKKVIRRVNSKLTVRYLCCKLN